MLNAITELASAKDLCARIRSCSDGAAMGSLGLLRAARFPMAAMLSEQVNRPILYLTDKPSQAMLAYDEIGFWCKSAERFIFPSPEPLFYEHAGWGLPVHRDRILVLTQLIRMLVPGCEKPQTTPLIIAPIQAVMTRTLDRRSFIKSMKNLRVGEEISQAHLVQMWSESGYESVDTVLESGQFSKRGGLLDIWPHSEPYPLRLDFFGDEIDSIHRFDPSSQRNIVALKKILIPPGSEVIPAMNPTVEIPLGAPSEFYLPLVHTVQACLLDYLPNHTLIVSDDWNLLKLFADELEEQSEALRAQSIAAGTLDESYPEPYVSISEIQDHLESFVSLDLGHSDIPEDNALADHFMPEERFGGHLPALMNFLLDKAIAHEPVNVISRQAARISDLWKQTEQDESNLSAPQISEASLSEGFVLRDDAGEFQHLLTDSEIFGWERPLPRKPQKQVIDTPEKYYADLKPGDYVVHVDYGIGQYAGLVSRQIEGISKEFLVVNYAQGDQLFIPVHQADRLTNYVGPNGKKPEMTRLGTKDWLNARNFVRENVLEVANDLLDLYARRQVTEGFAFSPDNTWQQDMEGAFPYEETEDQKIAIQKVKEDMERPRPMDRLICGDVGYGKTEIALRAAFKATCDSKQVAILVPTTVLAQQHYETFRKRFAAYPVNVEMLSRFRTAKEQTQILKKLAEGEIDVIIGTHRLVSSDVKFKDLGLVVIDEEQRFGVAQKEHLKKLRAKVDVLTMTATPIPRTLYMALTGVRDISNINTPPYERVPVTTYVGPYSEKLIRQAVLREMERGGQTFFVHNRVQSIYVMNTYLQKLIPEARIAVAHGQLPEKQLSAVMDQFYQNKLDILLCTSIIESGLDVPNANTLIVNRADMFGLAQLYQIRGRVGRSSQRAYAYFFRQKNHKPTEAGLERLEVIAENTQFGAGYAIAMRDLEMRGAGEILGSRQHGAIASVGFHLYTRMLAQAVRNVRTLKGVEISDEDLGITRDMASILDPIAVELPLDAGIPETYIEDPQTRIKLYRRMAALNTQEDLDAMKEEFSDRFGMLPTEVSNLFYQIQVKIFAERIGLSAVAQEGTDVVLRFTPLPDGVESRNLPQFSRGIRSAKNAYRLINLDLESDAWKDQMLEQLESIELHLQAENRR